jgi:DNA-binding response OmpR family regulator
MTQRLRILVVEDEMTIAMMLEDMLAELGHEVVAVASRLPQARSLAESSDIDLAILDVNLGGEASFPAAHILQARHVPFFFATGYGATGIATEFADAVSLKKPYLIEHLREAIHSVHVRPEGGTR